MSGWIQDLRYALRQLHKNPGFTAVALITMALGIGANTTAFSNINAMLVGPFPFHRLDRLVTIWETVPQQNADRVSAAPANFRDWSEQSGAFQQLAALQGWDANQTGSNVAEHVEGYRISASRADVLRLVLGAALRMSAIGLAIGLTLSWLMTHALSSVLFGILQINLGMFAALTVLPVAVAGFAAYMAARWAMRVDPMVALR